MKLTSGLYEQLVTTELHDLLADPDWVTTLEELGEDAAADLLSRHLFEAARRALRSRRGASKLQAQVGLANALLRELSVHAPDAVLRGDEVLPQVLLAAQTRQQQGLGTQAPPRPGIPLRHSELIVNGPRDRRVGLEIERELPSADRVDVLMSFVKWSGFVELKDALARFSGRLRLLTTRAMLGGGTRAELREAVEEGFPSLPSGCSIQLEARAQAAVLANLKRTLGRWPALADDLEPGMGVADFLRRADLDVVDLYRSTKSFVELRARKGLLSEVPQSRLVRVLCRLTDVDDPMRLRSWQRLVRAAPLSGDKRAFQAVYGLRRPYSRTA